MSNQLDTQLRPEIRSVLVRLRRRIRRYVFLVGTALVACVLAVLFWLSLGVDWAWFQLSSLELPRWFRAAFLVLAVCLFAFTFVAWVTLRSLQSLRERALALVLERRFPELDDRLITAVELADSTSGRETPLTVAMLNRTLEDVTRLSGTLEIGAVFEKTPLRRAMILAAVLIASIAGFAWTNQEAMARWQKGYLALEDEYWNRETALTVKVIVQPGDRVREFRDQEYKHPRGGDLTLLVEVPETKKPDGSEWKVPDRVQLQYTLDAGRGSGSIYMSKLGDRQFRHSMPNVLDGMRFRIRGGDFTNRRPYRVHVVDPPRVDEIVLECDYPDYTGLNGSGFEHRRVQGTQISLPLETGFLMRATANKPLVGVRVEYDGAELAFGYVAPDYVAPDAQNVSENSGSKGGTESGAEDPSAASVEPEKVFQAKLTLKQDEGQSQETVTLPPEVARRFLASDGRSFVIPFALTTAETDAARERLERDTGGFGKPFVMAPDTPIRIYLEDADEIIGSEPARLTINGILDQPPRVETQLTGIGTSITRRAVIPVAGRIADDYGIADARFDFRVDDEQEWQPRLFRNRPEGSPREFELRRSGDESFETFEVTPLDLSIGQKLTLTVSARDGDNINGPHSGRGERFVFQIVSNEELLSILYGKEVNLRQRFEQIIREVEETRNDFILHRARVQEGQELRHSSPEPGEDEQHRAKLDEIDMAVTVSAERALHQVRKNASETAAIEESFRDILEELVNNAVHTRQMVDRIDGLIVRPLGRINNIDYPAVDEAVGLFKLANEQGSDPTPAIDDSVEAITAMLERMHQVLKEMEDLANFHEAVSRLQEIIEDSEKLHEETKAERKRRDLRKLKGLTD